jgi:ferredoxin
MPERYHITTQPVPPRRPAIGRLGVVEWREDCARCHNCAKKACVFDRHRQETQYIGGLGDLDVLFYQCMGCFSCVQRCTKGILALALNPAYERLGNGYWTPEVIQTTWAQAETGRIPVSGGGYRGPFSGSGFDSMWTDMSEIVRPTRDGIHGREYISTSVDIGRKLPFLEFHETGRTGGRAPARTQPPLVETPMPLLLDMMPPGYRIPSIVPIVKAAAHQTGLIAIVDAQDTTLLTDTEGISSVAFHVAAGAPLPQPELLRQTRIVEIGDAPDVEQRIAEVKSLHPGIVTVVRVLVDANGQERAMTLAHQPWVEAIHLVADMNGNQTGAEKPRFIKDIVRCVHTALVKGGVRDEITLIAGGGIALAEHMAKQLLCGADAVSMDLPLLIALECTLCSDCSFGTWCPARIGEATSAYGVGRMVNLIGAWHDQLIEVMGAMGIREARRLRGEAGRAMFFEDLEEETFGKLFGTRKTA